MCLAAPSISIDLIAWPLNLTADVQIASAISLIIVFGVEIILQCQPLEVSSLLSGFTSGPEELDMIDVLVLAKSLAPAMPYLLSFGKNTAEGAARAIGADTWKWAQSVWQKLWPRVEKDSATLETAQDAAKDPRNELVQMALAHRLGKLLQNDKSLADELERLMDQGKHANVIVTGERAVGLGGDAVHTTIITGDQGQSPAKKKNKKPKQAHTRH